MDNRFNTIAGWGLFAATCALGLSIGSGMFFSSHAPEKPGYPIEDAEAAGGGGESAVPLANLLAAADPGQGETIFAKCSACHTINQGGANGIGPNLWAALGKSHGHVAGFAYSDALKSVPGNWTFEAMDAWLASPRKYANGTKMSFAGLSSPEDRAAVIAYMNSQGSNLPLPAPEAAAAPDASAETPAEGAEGEVVASDAAATDTAAPAATEAN